MELDERKRRILGVIADLYTRTGEPVGSKLVSVYLDSAYSPATIRNDMAALFELGLLEQPHTSAGRVPSHLGYRVFVDDLMKVRPVSGQLRDSIEAMFNIRDPDPDKLLEDAAKALSEITGCAAFTTTLTPDSVTVRRVEIVPSGESSLVLMVMTSSGVIRSKVCRTSFRVTGEVVEFLRAFCAGKIVGLTLKDISLRYMSTVSVELGEYSRVFTPLLAAIFELCSEIYAGQYYMEGGIKLLQYPELSRNAGELLGYIWQRENIQRLADQAHPTGTTIFIGKENQSQELQNCSAVISKYAVGGRASGAIGIIGPIRMDYAAMVAETEYFARLMGELLTEIFDE
ncbi:MAG: heat-inducible transcription repressor HrcA [Clostridiales bacterium]|nr:heat-inducible transcription repressor HrcA [Clostridiales bacterium]